MQTPLLVVQLTATKDYERIFTKGKTYKFKSITFGDIDYFDLSNDFRFDVISDKGSFYNMSNQSIKKLNFKFESQYMRYIPWNFNSESDKTSCFWRV